MKTTARGRGGRRRAIGAGLAVAGAALLCVAALTVGQEARTRQAAPKPEYARVAALKGVLSRKRISGETRTIFTTLDKKWAAVLLQCGLTRALEDEVGAAERPPTITMTGVVTEYRGFNYLLPLQAEVGPPPPLAPRPG